MKHILIIIASLFLLLSIIVGFLPTIISTEWGNHQVVNLVNRSIPGKLAIGKLDASWLKGTITIQEVSLSDPEGSKVVSFDQLTTASNLWQIWTGASSFGNIQISGLEASIISDEKGSTNLQRALLPSADIPFAAIPPSTIILSGVMADIDLGSKQQPLKINVSGTTSQGKQEGTFNIAATMLGTKAQVHGKIDNFPIDLLEHLVALKDPKLNGLFRAALGDSLSLRLDQQLDGGENAFNLSLQSPLAAGELQGKISANGEFFLSTPAHFQLKLKPALVALLAKDQVTLQNEATIQLNVDKLSIPLHSKSDRFDLSFKGDVQIADALLAVPKIGELHLINLKSDVEIVPGASVAVQVKAQAQQNQQPFQLAFHSLFNAPQTWKEWDAISLQRESALNLTGFPLQIMDDLAQGNGKLVAQLGSFGDLNVALKNQGADLFKMDAQLRTDRAPVSFNIEQFKLSPKTFDLATLVMQGSLSINALALQPAGGQNVTLKKLYIPWEINAPANRINFNLDGVAVTDAHSTPSPIKAACQIENWIADSRVDLTTTTVQLDATLQEVPTPLINALLMQDDLSPLIGPSLAVGLKAHLDVSNQPASYANLNVQSQRLTATASLKMENGAIVLDKKTNQVAQLQWTITPTGYQLLKKLAMSGKAEGGVTIAEPLTLVGTITTLSLPLKGNSISLDDAKIDARLTTSGARIQALPPLSVTIALSSTNMAEKAILAFDASINSQSTLGLKANLSSLKAGALAQMQIDATLDAKKFPLEVISALALLDPKTERQLFALIGRQMEAQAHVRLHNLNGSVSANINGNQGKLSLDGSIQKGTLFLNRAFEYEVPLTQDLIKAMSDGKASILDEIISSDQPLRVVVEPKGFAIQLSPLDWKAATIPQGKIELGKVLARNDGQLKDTLSFLKPVKDDKLTIWFTPIYFQMGKGMLSLKRWDMLLGNQYTFATWGQIDLNQDKLDLTLGLTERTLRTGFGVPNLSKDYMLQIPVKGRKGKISVDTSKVTTRISGLAARASGSLEGMVVGTVLDFAAGGFEDPTPPKPTTNPFPWPAEPASEKKDSSKTNLKIGAPASAVIKELEKGASSLLDLLK